MIYKIANTRLYYNNYIKTSLFNAFFSINLSRVIACNPSFI